MTLKSTFVKGSSTFICSCCGHNTRWTGEQGVGSKTCPICWDLAGYENMEQDGQMTEQDGKHVASIFQELKARSEEEYQRALKSFDLIAHYVTSEKENTVTVALIDIANLKVEFHADPEAARAKAEKQDLLYVGKPEDLGDGLSGPQMVALYNATAAELNTGLTPVNRFATKEAAVKRTMANITDLWELRRTMAKAQATPAPAQKVKPAASTAPRRGTGINLAPQKKVYACREGSKQALLVDLLNRPQGATMAELLDALSGGAKPWKEVTVKSGLNWDMNKVKGYGIRTTKRGDEDCYHLVLPEGMAAPVPHTPRKGA